MSFFPAEKLHGKANGQRADNRADGIIQSHFRILKAAVGLDGIKNDADTVDKQTPRSRHDQHTDQRYKPGIDFFFFHLQSHL